MCLSLLGTWEGPGWDPAVSTIYQVLLSIQSLIMNSWPYHNEPSYEGMAYSPRGRLTCTLYNTEVSIRS